MITAREHGRGERYRRSFCDDVAAYNYSRRLSAVGNRANFCCREIEVGAVRHFKKK